MASSTKITTKSQSNPMIGVTPYGATYLSPGSDIVLPGNTTVEFPMTPPNPGMGREFKNIYTNQQGQNLFPGEPTVIKGKSFAKGGMASMQSSATSPTSNDVVQTLAKWAKLKGIDYDELVKEFSALDNDQQVKAYTAIASKVKEEETQQMMTPSVGMLDNSLQVAQDGGCIDCQEQYPQAQNLNWFYKAEGGEAYPQANMYPESWVGYSGTMYADGGEAFPQAQTYLPYDRAGETRPNTMFADGGTADQFGGQFDPEKVYNVMKKGGLNFNPKKKKGGALDGMKFTDYLMRNGGLMKFQDRNSQPGVSDIPKIIDYPFASGSPEETAFTTWTKNNYADQTGNYPGHLYTRPGKNDAATLWKEYGQSWDKYQNSGKYYGITPLPNLTVIDLTNQSTTANTGTTDAGTTGSGTTANAGTTSTQSAATNTGTTNTGATTSAQSTTPAASTTTTTQAPFKVPGLTDNQQKEFEKYYNKYTKEGVSQDQLMKAYNTMYPRTKPDIGLMLSAIPEAQGKNPVTTAAGWLGAATNLFNVGKGVTQGLGKMAKATYKLPGQVVKGVSDIQNDVMHLRNPFARYGGMQYQIGKQTTGNQDNSNLRYVGYDFAGAEKDVARLGSLANFAEGFSALKQERENAQKPAFQTLNMYQPDQSLSVNRGVETVNQTLGVNAQPNLMGATIQDPAASMTSRNLYSKSMPTSWASPNSPYLGLPTGMYGGSYEDGGEYDLDMDTIRELIRLGYDVEMI